MFGANWISNPDCKTLINSVWSMDKRLVLQYISNTAHTFKRWHKNTYQKANTLKKYLESEILSLRKGILTQDVLNDICKKRNDLEAIYNSEELYLKQRVKTHWAKFGDRNTKFFHEKAKARNKTN